MAGEDAMEFSRGGTETRSGVGTRSLDDVTGAIVDTAFKLHVALGPGLLESVYEVVLARHLARQEFLVQRQQLFHSILMAFTSKTHFGSTFWSTIASSLRSNP